jgi:hypothetical protein
MKIHIVLTLCFLLIGLVGAVSEQEATLAIENSKEAISRVESNGFLTIYLSDLLRQAEMVFEQLRYAEILRSSSNETEKNEARIALRLVDWKNINYEGVLVHTNLIIESENKIYEISDSLIILEKRLEVLNDKQDFSRAYEVFNEAKRSFEEERYEEALNKIEETKGKIEEISSEYGALAVLGTSTQSFFYRYWLQLIIFLVVVFVVYLISYKIFKKKRIKKNMIKKQIQLVALKNLMIKTQEERFKKNKISGLVYSIRMKSYQSKIENIEQELDLFEEKIKGI